MIETSRNGERRKYRTRSVLIRMVHLKSGYWYTMEGGVWRTNVKMSVVLTCLSMHASAASSLASVGFVGCIWPEEINRGCMLPLSSNVIENHVVVFWLEITHCHSVRYAEDREQLAH